MKNRIEILSLALVLAGCTSVNVSVKKNFEPASVKRVGVLSFATPFHERGGELGQLVSDFFSQELLKLGFAVIERGQIEKVMGEIRLDQSGAIDPATAKEVGRVAGVEAVVIGSLSPSLSAGSPSAAARPVGRRYRQRPAEERPASE